MEDLSFGIISFLGAMSFVFSLKTERDGPFFFYTLIFATCVAALVVNTR